MMLIVAFLGDIKIGGKCMRKLIESKDIGKSIKNLRKARNLTQSELANLIFYSERNIRRLENEGTSNLYLISQIAEVFGVSVFDILEGCFLLLKNKKTLAVFTIQCLL